MQNLKDLMTATRKKLNHNTIGKMDKEICKGCLPVIIAREVESSIGLNCHGNPFIRLPDAQAKEQKIICPCSICLVKGMCRNICSLYNFYRNLGSGMSYKEYKELIDEPKRPKN